MLEKVSLHGIEMPTLYVASNRSDVKMARQHGLPYVRWSGGAKSLLRQMLRPALEMMFPHILWDKVLGERDEFKTKIVNVPGGEVKLNEEERRTCESGKEETADIATERRWFSGKIDDGGVNMSEIKLEHYVGDLSSYVNLDVLQELSLMPSFMGDIVDCIKVNLMNNMSWTEGYNKKLGQAIGNFNGNKALPNLIILDISGSIPRGISATMLTLIDTMREQVQADLIITAAHSELYPYGTELPSPKDLRERFGYGNESEDFFNIMDEHVRGKEWGHVISFGDVDSPSYTNYITTPRREGRFMGDTIVHHVHHYHTGQYLKYADYKDHRKLYTGYALWCTEYAKEGTEVSVDTSWCNIIDK